MGNKAAVSHYISAKHAMNGFTKAVAFEYGQQGIPSNAICPGAVETERTKEIAPAFAAANGLTYAEDLADYAKDAATGRLNTVEEVGAQDIALAADDGGGITGSLRN